MSSSWQNILFQVVFFVIVMIVVYKQLKEKVLYKYNPDKWVILIAAGLLFLVPFIVEEYFHYNISATIWQYLVSAVFIILFLWFFDIQNGSIKKLQDAKAGKSAEKIKAAEKKPAHTQNRKKNKNRDARRRK